MDSQSTNTSADAPATDDLEDLIRDARLHAIVARTLAEEEIKPNPKDAGYTYPLSREQMEIIHFAVNNTELALIKVARHAGARS